MIGPESCFPPIFPRDSTAVLRTSALSSSASVSGAIAFSPPIIPRTPAAPTRVSVSLFFNALIHSSIAVSPNFFNTSAATSVLFMEVCLPSAPIMGIIARASSNLPKERIQW